MENGLLVVLICAPHLPESADDVLRALRRACPRHAQENCVYLLLADLPDADSEHTPQDDRIIRRLQSGVMAMRSRRPGEFELIVRRRVWNDAARRYLGIHQPQSPVQTVVQLMLGEKPTPFAVNTCSPAAFANRFDAVLFADLSLAFLPDTPARMHAQLKSSGHAFLCGSVVRRAAYPQSILSRLEQQDFSLNALHSTQTLRLRRKNMGRFDPPVMIARRALHTLRAAPPSICPAAQDCLFVRRDTPSLAAHLNRLFWRVLHAPHPADCLAILQIILLVLSAALGMPWLTLFALLPEAVALAHPSQMPCALMRIALLPLTSASVLDALLCRIQARAKLLRIRLPTFAHSPLFGAALGALLLAAAFFGVYALYALLPIALLWLSAPLLVPALHKPTIERIPATQEEHAQLRALAGDAFFDCLANAPQQTSPPRLMLVACAGGMLGLLEPDETARRVQEQLRQMEASQIPCPIAADQAAMFASAQYLREHMAACDAELRPLPAQLESAALRQPVPQENSPLAALLRLARGEPDLSASYTVPQARPEDALFLPLQPLRSTRMRDETLALTHPHTYLNRQLSAQANAPDEALVVRFFALCAAALDHPFHALLTRSPVTASTMAVYAG